MKLFRLGRQGNFRSMTLFHALARLGMEGLVLVEPNDHFVCLGYFDNATETVDFEFCTKQDLPVMRREVGGGVVLLGPGQLFYQLILRRGDPRMPLSVAEAYRNFSLAPIGVYRRLGMQVNYKPINDLVTAQGRKISGQGAADIGACFVFVGNILLNFDPWLMSRCVRVPDEKFREVLCGSLEDNLTWVGRELGSVPERNELERIIQDEFEKVIGPLEEGEIPSEAWELADSLACQFTSKEFIFMETPRKHSTIKIKEGTYIRFVVQQLADSFIRAEVKVDGGKIDRLFISGGSALVPESEFSLLSHALHGVDFNFACVSKEISVFFREHGLHPWGIQPEDLAFAIVGEREAL